MSGDYSKKALLQFLDYLGDKGLMNNATVSARKAAANTLLGILSDDEVSDLRALDLEEVNTRFANLKGTEFKPESIRVYRSRVRSAIHDFLRYRENPAAFKPAIQAKNPSPRKSQDSRQDRGQSSSSFDFNRSRPSDIVFPIPIRSDVVVQIYGIPSDLTDQEARRIANVVMALAQTTE